MTTLEVLLIVLTSAVVLLIVIVSVVLVVMFQLIRKVKDTTEQIQELTERTNAAADRLAPMGVAAASVYQLVRFINRLRR
jgi:CHASE3 domain sensor protein